MSSLTGEGMVARSLRGMRQSPKAMIAAAVCALLLLAGRARDFVVGNAATSAVAGVAATAALGSLVYIGAHQGSATAPGASEADAAPGPGPAVVAPHRHPEDRARHQQRHQGRTTGPTVVATTLPGVPDPVTLPHAPSTATQQPPSSPGQDQPSQPSEPSDPAQPSQPAQPPPLAASIALTQHADGTYLVALTVTGTSAAGAASVAVTGDTGSGVITHDLRCSMNGPASGICDLPSTPALLLFQASAPHDDGLLRFVVSGADGVRRTLQVSLH